MLLIDLMLHVDKYIVIINSCILVFGFVGNIITCVVIVYSKSMHTPADFYLLSLSLSDLLILTIGVSYTIYFYNYDLTSLFDSLKTKLIFYTNEWILDTSVNASVLTVTAFTVERYLAICHPFFIQSMAKTSRVKKIITLIWLVAAVLALLPVARFALSLEILVIGRRWHKIIINARLYMFYIWLLIYFALPMLLIIVMYTLISIKLNETSIASPANGTNKKTLAMFAVIIIVFCISWAPYFAWPVLLHTGNGMSQETRRYVEKVCQISFTLSSALNPLIYVMMSNKFRNVLKNLLPKSPMTLIERSSTVTYTQTDGVSLEIT